MSKPITWVGIDDDKMNLTVAVLVGEQRDTEAEVRRIPNEDRSLGRWVRRLVRAADGGTRTRRLLLRHRDGDGGAGREIVVRP